MASSSWRVLRTYPAFRWLLLTWICKDLGDWLVKVANLIVVQKWAGTGTALSHLVLSSLLPKAILAPVGGFLSDRYDRRHLMVIIDSLSGLIVLLFLVAMHYQSISLLYLVTAIRSAKAGMYYPVNNGLLPMIIPNAQDMQYASTLVNGVFGLMSIIGGMVAGSAAVVVGVEVCYLIDSVTYFVSVFVMLFCVSGDFKKYSRVNSEITDVETSPVEERVSTCMDVINYLATSGCAMLIFLKPTDSLAKGPGDIIGVEISTVRNVDGSENEAASSFQMGMYYCITGWGVIMGPALANLISDADRPVSLQQCCCLAMFLAMSGWVMAAYAPNYSWFLLASWWSGLGSGILWAYSSLLLQLLVDKRMIGRILAIEYFLFVMAEALSSSATGPLYDLGFSRQQLCLLAACVAQTSFMFWTVFHLYGGGAASQRFNQESDWKREGILVDTEQKPSIKSSVTLPGPTEEAKSYTDFPKPEQNLVVSRRKFASTESRGMTNQSCIATESDNMERLSSV